ncbi:FAD-dependent oxidoreductase [Rhizoctonia solani AG-3 Rhs1AP]|uniref:FAD-dependent oxidoreductase n=2 Tax=Rhizoctonia solani AG-3 TaxID=1086053 RepID=A0A074RM52_9AGAM|nr:FAD-dependent oxidoreductase [Rhizoctonia solani AG-3 Rhs1AP]KEP48166.1 FAD-dependent oxidoreductase [Rhizoctonia solani 123E]
MSGAGWRWRRPPAPTGDFRSIGFSRVSPFCPRTVSTELNFSSNSYYLSALAQDVEIHIVESVSIAAAASGKAGGFLALDWHSNKTKPLAALSFKLHQELADAHDGVKRWGYRRTHTLQLDIDQDRRVKSVPDAEWLKSISKHTKLGSEESTGQAHPFHLTHTLVEVAQSRGVQVHLGASASKINFAPDSDKVPIELVATKSDGSEIVIPATDIVFAAGPWTGSLARKLLGANDAGVAGTIEPSEPSSSIVLKPDASHTITNHMLFTDLTFNNTSCEPEVYPRLDGTVYLCGAGGENESVPLPERADQVKPSPAAIQRLKEAAEFVSPGTFENAQVVAEQCCFRPNSQTGLPVIGKVREGIWMASGHGVWGIQNGPGTGKCLAELILGLPTSADISQLGP